MKIKILIFLFVLIIIVTNNTFFVYGQNFNNINIFETYLRM